MGIITIDPARVQHLNQRPIREGRFVLYWMQQSQRAEANHALEYAIQRANLLEQPVLTVFGLTDTYPEANLRHYTFMLEGLQTTRAALAQRGIQLRIQLGSPPEAALNLGRHASLIVCDRGYLRHQRRWRRQVAREARCCVVQVESDVVVPVEVASNKAEYAARTIRPKIHRYLDQYLIPIKATPAAVDSRGLKLKTAGGIRLEQALKRLSIDRRVAPVTQLYKGGTGEAKKRFGHFVRHKLRHYADHSNQPQTDDISHMSMYLHFGQISPLYLALETRKARQVPAEAKARFIEELVVRRELAMNYVQFTRGYDRYAALPPWARKTLAEHQTDQRPYLYTRGQLERSQTHDPYWNAAMTEMRETGFMHNYMRMYWGKKIIEWTRTPQQAFRTALALNNKYFLDGRDPNSYTGVAWVFGLHDRAWQERSVFGKIRYMAASGLERKCDIQAYVDKVARAVERLEPDRVS